MEQKPKFNVGTLVTVEPCGIYTKSGITTIPNFEGVIVECRKYVDGFVYDISTKYGKRLAIEAIIHLI